MARRTAIFRILNYISPYPWGSLAAFAYRQLTSLSATLYQLDPSNVLPRPFCVGAGVQWVPLLAQLTDNGAKVSKLRTWGAEAARQGTWQLVWRAQRQKPMKRVVIGGNNPLVQSIGQELRSALKQQNYQQPSSAMWDNRFYVTLDVQAMPDALKAQLISNDGIDVQIRDESQFFYPRVVLVDAKTAQETQSFTEVSLTTGKFSRCAPWIKVAWIRPLHDLQPEITML